MKRALEEPIVVSIAEKIHAQPGQVALRWALQRGLSVVPKSTNPDRVKGNFEALNIELSETDAKAIDQIHPQVRALRFSNNYNPEGPFRNYEEFWDEKDVIEDYLKATGQEKVLSDA